MFFVIGVKNGIGQIVQIPEVKEEENEVVVEAKAGYGLENTTQILKITLEVGVGVLEEVKFAQETALKVMKETERGRKGRKKEKMKDTEVLLGVLIVIGSVIEMIVVKTEKLKKTDQR